VNDSEPRFDPWAIAAALLWLVYLCVGYVPEEVFAFLREQGRVVTQNALVNSPYLITIGFSMYFAYFAYHRCRECGLTMTDAQGRALQVGIVGLLAFLNIPLQTLIDAPDIPIPRLRNLVFAIFVAKSLAWLYLASLVFRYYILQNSRVFGNLVSVFPSNHTPEHEFEKLGKADSVAWIDPRDRADGSPEETPSTAKNEQ